MSQDHRRVCGGDLVFLLMDFFVVQVEIICYFFLRVCYGCQLVLVSEEGYPSGADILKSPLPPFFKGGRFLKLAGCATVMPAQAGFQLVKIS